MSPSLIYWFLTNKLATQQVFFACNRSSINFNAFIRSWCWTQFIYQVSKVLAPVIYFAKTFKFSSACLMKNCSKRFNNTLFRLLQIFMRKTLYWLLGKSNKHSTHDFCPRPATEVNNRMYHYKREAKRSLLSLYIWCDVGIKSSQYLLCRLDP